MAALNQGCPFPLREIFNYRVRISRLLLEMFFGIQPLFSCTREQMSWKPGQSGNYNGRPRAAYHWNGSTIIEEDKNDLKLYRDAQNRGFAAASGNGNGKDVLQDPILFQHKLLSDESVPLGLRVAIAQNIAPYVHPRVGIVGMPRYVETPIEVPAFQTIEDAESFLLTLSQRLGAGEVSIDAVNEITAIVRTWIQSKHQGQELELKRLAADNVGQEQVIRIEGGLPELPGTNIIMPPRPDGPEDIIHEPAQDPEPVDPAE